jgi:hypothetical protein
MKNDKDAFYQRKPFSKISIETNTDYKECKHKERSMPLFRNIGIWMIQDNKALNHSCREKESTRGCYLPCNGTKPSYIRVSTRF